MTTKRDKAAELERQFDTTQVRTIWVVNVKRYGSSSDHIRIYHERPSLDAIKDMSVVPWVEKTRWPDGIQNACSEFLSITGLEALPPHRIIEIRMEITADSDRTYPSEWEKSTKYDEDAQDDD